MQIPDSLTTRLHHPWCRVANPHLCKRARGQSLEWTRCPTTRPRSQNDSRL